MKVLAGAKTSTVHIATAPEPDNEALPVTDVPLVAVVLFWVSAALEEKPGPVFEVLIVWPVPAVHVALLVTPPRDTTKEPSRVVVTAALGALEPALLNVLFAPKAPEPLVPVVSTPVNVIKVAVLWGLPVVVMVI